MMTDEYEQSQKVLALTACVLALLSMVTLTGATLAVAWLVWHL